MIDYLWPTPVYKDSSPFTKDQITELLDYNRSRKNVTHASNHKATLSDALKSSSADGNLFDEIREVGAPAIWYEFRKWSNDLYRQYLTAAHSIDCADELEIMARCIFIEIAPGRRTAPHYHHTCDHVLCLYLDCGTDRPGENGEQVIVRGGGDGELILQDPRPMASFPYWEKTRYIDTQPGLAILHPSRVWHETNTFNAKGIRSLLTVTFRVVSHNYTDLYVKI